MEVELPKRIHQARPSVILNIDNEFMTFKLMDEVKSFYNHSSNDLPKRHYYNRFVKDFKQWTKKYVDFMHYSVPLVTANAEGFVFPGEYCGQYAVYEAVKHFYS
jgi:hypothetical protein